MIYSVWWSKKVDLAGTDCKKYMYSRTLKLTFIYVIILIQYMKNKYVIYE